MLERIVVHEVQNGGRDSPFDFGLLAEAMIFYGHTHFVISRSQVAEVLATFGVDTFVQTLPARVVRFFFFTALGTGGGAVAGGPLGAVVGAVLGAVRGFVDAFLVDPIAQGWKPNHFVHGPLRSFLGRRP